MNDVRRFHVEERGWDDIGYNLVITADGRVHKGRDWERVPACVSGSNRHAFCIAVTGDNTRSGMGWNDEQRSSLVAVIDTMVALTGADVKGHKDMRDTLCPGMEVSEYYQTIG